MPPPKSPTEFLQLVGKSGLLQPDALTRCAGELPNLPPETAKVATIYVRRGLLTKLQARLLLSGKYKGFLIGPYSILDEIGKGGMGAVYLAEHRTLRRRVALKVLLGDKVNLPGAVDRFFREARAAAALDHANIVRVFDVGQQGDSYYLVMEYVRGQTLDKLLAANTVLPREQAVEFAAQAAAGLQHAAEKGFIHRDIKPANLMVTDDGVVKILDMGLARNLSNADDVTGIRDKDAVLGTADYVSPEQAIHGAKVDIRADIYSLGATFFTLLTGRAVFLGNVAQKLINHQQAPPTRPSDVDPNIPEELSDVVVRMLAKHPDDRYQSPFEVILALAPWLPENSSLLAGLANPVAAGATVDTLSALTPGGSTNRLPRITSTGPRSRPMTAVSMSEIVLDSPPVDLLHVAAESDSVPARSALKPVLIGMTALAVGLAIAVVLLVLTR